MIKTNIFGLIAVVVDKIFVEINAKYAAHTRISCNNINELPKISGYIT